MPADWEAWLDGEGVPDGTPYLIAPDWGYDAALNGYFHRPGGLEEPLKTSSNRAYALERFLNFLHVSRGGKGWRDATEEDHRAFQYWRRRDGAGPLVDGPTWSQEVALVHQFYVWAKGKKLTGASPIPLRARRDPPPEVAIMKSSGRAEEDEGVPASYAHDGGQESLEWLPAAEYRRWRDVGVRGYTAQGLPDPGFRGRWAARNAAYTDLMVRTGMRITEQSSLTLVELPTEPGPGYRRFWLPGAVAKGGSARWVYVPASVRRDLADYVEFDRSMVVKEAQAERRYEAIRRPLVIEDPKRPLVARATSGALRGRRLDVRGVKPLERYRLLVEGADGLEPAMFWLGEGGMPLAVSTWKDMFTTANARCRAQGVKERAHAHALRHTFAVITLEQLQRGHIKALAEMNLEQRWHYQKIFGDPSDWVRRRLGHTSQVTTLIYLHALQELEMETRMALVPDAWEDPRDTAPGLIGSEAKPTDLDRV
jgi:integrase